MSQLLRFNIKLYHNQNYFIRFFFVFTAVSLLIIFFFDKITISLFFNRMHNAYSDVLFKYLTHLGDGLFFIFVLILLFISKIKLKNVFFGLFCFLVSGLIAQLLKKLIFTDSMRPMYYLANHPEINAIEGIGILTAHSFPSGHSATIFAFCFFLSFIFKKSIWMNVLPLSAILIALTRCYLLQHFYHDVIAGAFIGVFSVFLVLNIDFYFSLLRSKKKKKLIAISNE